MIFPFPFPFCDSHFPFPIPISHSHFPFPFPISISHPQFPIPIPIPIPSPQSQFPVPNQAQSQSLDNYKKILLFNQKIIIHCDAIYCMQHLMIVFISCDFLRVPMYRIFGSNKSWEPEESKNGPTCPIIFARSAVMTCMFQWGTEYGTPCNICSL